MEPQQWQRVKQILGEALDLDPGERRSFVEAACGGEPEVRSQVESFLAAEDEAGDFIEEPVFAETGRPLAEGQRVGVWRVLHEIGRGGMGAVYLAERADEEFEKRVALKVIRRSAGAEEIVRRFRTERQILAGLDHPHIARLLDGGTTEDDRPYLVMEHVEGRPIDVFCEESRLDLRQRLDLFRTVCRAVHFAHQNRVVHGDLKPGNILVGNDGAPRLVDFGIAEILAPDRLENAAAAGAGPRLMTLACASPEQVSGGTITTASDVYSLGALLYRLLTGRSPYGEPPPEGERLIRAIREEEPPPPSLVARPADRKRLAGDLDSIVAKAMRKDPQMRYASAEQLAADLQLHLDGFPVLAHEDTPGYRLGKFVRRHKLGVAAAAVFAAVVLGAVVALSALYREAVRERERAEVVSEFLEGLFQISDPSESRGENITAREVLDQGREKISSELGDQPVLRADLMNTMGRVYRGLGLYEPARELIEEGLRLRRATLGSDHPAVAESLLALASLQREAKDETSAEPLLREALAIQRRHGLTATPAHAEALANLGSLQVGRKEYAEAERLYEESLALKRRLHGEESEEVARGLSHLAYLFYMQGRLDEAEARYRETLALRRKVLGDDHPEVATTLSNLGSLLEEQGDAAGAEAVYRDVLARRRKIYDPRHPVLAMSLSNLGFALQAQGRHREAEPLYREALSIADERLGPMHRNRAVYLGNLASALLEQKRAAEAEPLAREALEIFRTTSPGVWRVADAESVLGGCLARLGRFAEAEPMLLGSYAVLAREPEGSGARAAPAALERIVVLYKAWGRPDKAAVYQNLRKAGGRAQ
jgi:tetratricopeptide (TPR) repeat protein